MQGEGITAHLKKVDKSQMTHKNPELRASSVVKAAEKPAAAAAGVSAISGKEALLYCQLRACPAVRMGFNTSAPRARMVDSLGTFSTFLCRASLVSQPVLKHRM
jgi:hypothetical protein